jgi:hypothetical protein
MPMDRQHAQETRKLKEKQLVKVEFGTNGEYLILHKNTTNKISHNFNLKGNLISVFLHHDPENRYVVNCIKNISHYANLLRR